MQVLIVGADVVKELERLVKGEKVIAWMQAGDIYNAGFVGLLKVGLGEEELLAIQDGLLEFAGLEFNYRSVFYVT